MLIFLDNIITLENMDWKLAIFYLIGGLGIFLFGVSLMGDTLKAIAGNRMKKIIEKTTNTPLKGILVGALVTGLLQSSSGTTALTISLVRSGLMTLPQAVGIIMGANIGTTVTSLLYGIKIADYALVIVGIGAIGAFFFKNKKIKDISMVLVGFGLLFYGLDLMGEGLTQITNTVEVKEWLTSISSNPILGLLVGTGLTAIVQSSSAVVAMLQSLYNSGGIVLLGALPILLGSNIGTTITAVLASIGGSVPSKRAACVHVIFNVLGAIFFMIILQPIYYPVVQWLDTGLSSSLGDNPLMTIGIAHLIFNIVCTLAMVWFIKQLVWLAEHIIPGEATTPSYDQELLRVDLIEESPTIALELAKRAIDHMGKLVRQFFHISIDYSFAEDKKLRSEADQIEDSIDGLNETIHHYLIEITKHDITDSESHILSKYLDTIRDLERIGDHCMNVFEFFQERYDASQVLSEGGNHDLRKMYSLLDEMMDISLKSLLEGNRVLAGTVAEIEERVDRLEEKYRKKHVLRLNNGVCSVSNVDNFVDILSNLERIGDHCNNIAGSIMTDVYYVEDEDDEDDIIPQKL